MAKTISNKIKEIVWHNEKRKISELKPFEGNPRQANEKKQKNDILKSF